jgi:hypothetical protein
LSWTKTQKIFAGVGALIAASPSMAGTIVIRASGPSAKAFPVGKTLAEGQRVALKTGDTLVLLDPKGTRTLTGAGNFEVGTAANGAQAPSAFKALIANAGTRQVRTGAVRGANAGPVRVASLWYVDTSKGGTVCLKDPLQANLWRADMSQPVTVTLSGAGHVVTGGIECITFAGAGASPRGDAQAASSSSATAAQRRGTGLDSRSDSADGPPPRAAITPAATLPPHRCAGPHRTQSHFGRQKRQKARRSEPFTEA